MERKLLARVSPSDIVQETFLEATRDFNQFRGTCRNEFGAWLRKILINNLRRAVEQHVLTQKRDVRREVSLQAMAHALEQSTVRLETILPDPGVSPSGNVHQNELQIQLADKLAELPDDYRQVEARQLYTQALQLFEQLRPASGASRSPLHNRATCLNELGLLEASQGDASLAKQHYQDAIRQQSELAEAEHDDPHMVRTLAEMQVNLGLLQRQIGENDQAKSNIQQAIALLQQLFERYPQEPRHAHDLAIALNNLSFVEQEADWQAARNSCQAAIEILESLLATKDDAGRETHSEDLELKSDLALCYNNLGAIESHVGQHRQACVLHRQAIEQQRAAVARAPRLVACRENLNKHYLNYGRALRKANRPLAAAKAAHQRRQLRANDGQHLYHVARELAQAASQLDEHHQAEARKKMAEDAVSLLEQARTAQQQPLSGPIHVADFLAFKNHVGFQNLLSKEK